MTLTKARLLKHDFPVHGTIFGVSGFLNSVAGRRGRNCRRVDTRRKKTT